MVVPDSDCLGVLLEFGFSETLEGLVEEKEGDYEAEEGEEKDESTASYSDLFVEGQH